MALFYEQKQNNLHSYEGYGTIIIDNLHPRIKLVIYQGYIDMMLGIELISFQACNLTNRNQVHKNM